MTSSKPVFPVADPSPIGSDDQLPGGTPLPAAGPFLPPATHAEPEAMCLAEARAVVALVAGHDDQTIVRACQAIFYSRETDSSEKADAQRLAALLGKLLFEHVTCSSVSLEQAVQDQIRRTFHVQV